jgi:hypothetical protein
MEKNVIWEVPKGRLCLILLWIKQTPTIIYKTKPCLKTSTFYLRVNKYNLIRFHCYIIFDGLLWSLYYPITIEWPKHAERNDLFTLTRTLLCTLEFHKRELSHWANICFKICTTEPEVWLTHQVFKTTWIEVLPLLLRLW